MVDYSLGASSGDDRAVVNGAASVSAVPASVPSALDFDLAFEAACEPEEQLSLQWIALGVDRMGEAYVMDADPDFFKVDLLPEFWACDNGIEYPEGLASGLYLMTEIVITPDSCGDPTFKGTIKPLLLVAKAIEAQRAETQSGSVHESAVTNGHSPESADHE